MSSVLCDWSANRGNRKGQVVLLLFRLGQQLQRLPRPARILARPYFAFYNVFVGWILGIELRLGTRVGPGLRLYHGQGLLVHELAVIGSHCTVRHSTTIGHKLLDDGAPTGSPVIGDYVDIGANSVIIGPITIGDYATIGAGSVVVKDVPPRAVVAGNPARCLRIKEG